MKGKTTKWLLWGGILCLLGVEIVLLMGGREKPAETEQKPSATSATPQLVTVPFAPSSRRGAVATDKSTATAGAAETQPTVAAQPVIDSGDEDPLSLESLQQLVQPPGALLNEALLTFATKEAYDAFLRRAASLGLTVRGGLEGLLTTRVGFESLEQLRADLINHRGEGTQVSANYTVDIPRLPAPEERGPGGDVPFGDSVFSAMGISPTVDRSQWGNGITVAVVDSGVGEHPTFRSGQVTHVDLVNDGQPIDGHGTAIASLIAGTQPGAQGIAPGAKIIDIQVAGSNGESNSFQLAQGITEATNRGADVINVSMGSYGDASVVRSAVQAALDKGIVIVAAAGNDKASAMAWPAAYDGVISVSGVDAKGEVAYFSNVGNPTIAAPGVGIPSAYFQQNKPYLAMGSGTSQSSALVAGAVATILSRGGNVMLTLNRNAMMLSSPRQSVGAGMLRLPQYR